MGAPGPASKPATNLPTGSEAGSAEEMAGLAGSVEVATEPLAPKGPLSQCEPYREIILAKVQQELFAKRIRRTTWPSPAPRSATPASGDSSIS
jgi:hypothetical protein